MKVSFAKASTQAKRIMQGLQGRGNVVESVRTVASYEAALTKAAQWLKDEYKAGRELGDLKSMTPDQAIRYLQERGEEIGQKALDQERQALQCMMRHSTSQLAHNERLPTIASERQQVLKTRGYTSEQVQMVSSNQKEANALATDIARHAGLRAHELLTLRPVAEQPPSNRPARPEKFSYAAGERYTVVGKGGLCREVVIPGHLAERLEALRLPAPQRVTDRGVYYQQHYAISGGQRWSSSFTQASKRVLGWSRGAHGLRHSYAQDRVLTLQLSGLNYRDALEVVSQEMGHFRPEITEVYLR